VLRICCCCTTTICTYSATATRATTTTTALCCTVTLGYCCCITSSATAYCSSILVYCCTVTLVYPVSDVCICFLRHTDCGCRLQYGLAAFARVERISKIASNKNTSSNGYMHCLIRRIKEFKDYSCFLSTPFSKG
jgi:hypothetical protein